MILLKDYFGWTNEDTIDKYLSDLKVQYARKIQPDHLQFGSRTLDRYLKLFREKELAHKIMDEVDDGKVKIRKHPGRKAIVNPSDPDASIDNKGVGYQVQVSETYNPENPFQIITAALPQTASESDQNAVRLMLEKMVTLFLPQMSAATALCSRSVHPQKAVITM